MRKYDAYCLEVKELTSQLVQNINAVFRTDSSGWYLLLCRAEQFETTVDLFIIECSADIKTLTDDDLWTYLDKMAVDSSKAMTELDLDNMVLKYLRMDVSVRSAKASM